MFHRCSVRYRWLSSRVVSVLDSGAEGPWVQIAAATLSSNSLMQTVHTHRASVYQAANLVGLGQLGVADSARPTRQRQLGDRTTRRGRFGAETFRRSVSNGDINFQCNGLITIAIRARFEYDSTTIRLRFGYNTLQHATRFFVRSRTRSYTRISLAC